MSENFDVFLSAKHKFEQWLQGFHDAWTQVLHWNNQEQGVSSTLLFFSPSIILIFFSIISHCAQCSSHFVLLISGVLGIHAFLKLTHNPVSTTLHYQFLYTCLLALFILYFGPALSYNQSTILLAVPFPLYYHILTSSVYITLLISAPILILLLFSSVQDGFTNPLPLVILIVAPTIFWTKLREIKQKVENKQIQEAQEINHLNIKKNLSAHETLVIPENEEKEEKEKIPENPLSDPSMEENEKVILGISHDCRNLLNSLKSILTLMKDDSNIGDEPHSFQDDNLQSAIAIAEHLTLLLTNLLDYLKKNEDPKSNEEMRLTSTLEKIWLMISPNLKRKNLGGSITIKNGTPLNVNLDERKLMGILLNLVGNAIKFTDTGHIKINVHWRENTLACKNMKSSLCDANANLPLAGGALKKPGLSPAKSDCAKKSKEEKELTEANAVFSKTTFFDMRDIDSISFAKKCFTVVRDAQEGGIKPVQGWLVLTVRDTGCGIDEDSLKKLFKKYMQVGEDPEKNRLGYGLGLWYTKYLLTKIKGKIDFRSTKDVGTWVKVEIPCKVMQQRREIRQMIRPEISVPQVLNTHHNKKPCVFIRENDRMASLIIAEYLKKHNTRPIDVVETANINEILRSDKIKSNICILILGEGSATRQEIQALKMLLHIHGDQNFILMLLREPESSFGPKDNAWDSLEMNFVVRKPMRQAQLLEVTRNIEVALDQELFRRSVRKPDEEVANVLIVDDEGTSVLVLHRYLSKNGIACSIAKDGEEAVELYNKEWRNIRVILMDSEMPKMNGLEATKLIRQLNKSSNLKIIGLTGNDTEDFRERAIASGMDEVYVKPVPCDQLFQIVNNILKFYQGQPL